jgi:hypothetical protein
MLYPYFDLNERPVEPPTTPPRMIVASQVSNDNGIANTGNNVLSDQIVARGIIIATAKTIPIIIKYFIVRTPL